MKGRFCILVIGFIILFRQSILSQTNPDTVKIGCYVISLHNFNFPEKEYNARLWLWMVYANTQISFSHNVEVPNAKSFTIDETILDSLVENGKTKRWVQMKLNCTMKQSWNITGYPFDYQHLKILVENTKYDARNLSFVVDTVGEFYDPKLLVDGWDITDFKVNTGISNYSTNFGESALAVAKAEYANLEIDITLQRNAWGLFFKLFLGMYVAFSIAYVSFYINPRVADPRFGLPVGGLFSAVGNKYIVDGYLPDSSQITIVDWLHGLTFIMILAIIIFSAYALKLEQQRRTYKNTDKIARWVVLIFYVITNLGFILAAYWS